MENIDQYDNADIYEFLCEILFYVSCMLALWTFALRKCLKMIVSDVFVMKSW